ncbi:uncharacterized protein Dvir_GJ15196 [Drosophila virilis]|uniref:Clip domain-containing protein n=2 Tax=Drosophila virilis TaxID=7244 RepID=B4MD63_DROVI|nr:uncharacterized protein Dvir_GJ15196 [Drosophila virilis]
MLRVVVVLSALIWLCLSSCCCGYYSLQVADSCPTRGYLSSCQPADQCSTLAQFIESGRLSADAVLNCGYTTTGEKICCPREEGNSTNLRFSSSDSRANDTQATTPSWLNIFRTDREYLASLVTTPAPVSSSSIVFPNRVTETGAACQTPLYKGICEAVSDCQSLVPLLQQRRLRDEDVQTCRDGTVEEIICCPTNLPLHPIGHVGAETRLGKAADDDAAAIAKAVELLPHYTHLAALAYPNAAFDGHVHRCTALALTPQLLLSSAGCGHASHGVFGVADMRDVDEEEDYLVDITGVDMYRQDLALLRLAQSMPVDQPKASHVSLAPICSQFELTRLQVSGQLLASAWGMGNGSDCPLYELPMRLLNSDACRDIGKLSAVQDLPSSHLCLAPRDVAALSASNVNSCAPCPAVVGSVLHLRRPSGSRCVLAIATPTGDKCNAEAMYFTSLLDTRLVYFVEQQQQQYQQQQQQQQRQQRMPKLIRF